jgi:hypothetical protein
MLRHTAQSSDLKKLGDSMGKYKNVVLIALLQRLRWLYKETKVAQILQTIYNVS